jgi:hypothetical protein
MEYNIELKKVPFSKLKHQIPVLNYGNKILHMTTSRYPELGI